MKAYIEHDDKTGWFTVMVEGDTFLETRSVAVAIEAVLFLRRQ